MTDIKDKILAALAQVDDPDLHRDIVSLNMVQDLQVDTAARKVRFRLVLTTPACPLKNVIRNACVTAIQEMVASDLEVEVEFDSKVAANRRQTAHAMEGVKNIIAVASGKGGVGKSTVSVNLAIALAESGASVGLLDADIYGPSLPTMMGIRGIKPDVVQYPNGLKIIPFERHGIKTMSIGWLVAEEQALVWRGPMISNALKQLMTDVEWGALDYLVVDMPPGTGDIYLTLSQQFPLAGVVMVTTPQQVALDDVRKSMTMFGLPGVEIPVLGVVENMSYMAIPDSVERLYPFGKGAGREVAEQYNIPLLAEIPLFNGMATQADKGMPAMAFPEENENWAAPFRKLAGEVARRVAVINLQSAYESNPYRQR